jgi:hypothetical protein
MKFASLLPDRILWFNQKSEADLVAWQERNWRVGEKCTSIDYTAWERGMDWGFWLLIEWFLLQLSIPPAQVSDMLLEFEQLHTFLGVLPRMMPSGSAGTLFFNSLAQLAASSTVMKIPPVPRHPHDRYRRAPDSDPRWRDYPAFGFLGDDFIYNGDPGQRPEFNPRSWALAPKIKVEQDGEFVGFQLNKKIAVTDDHLMFMRAVIGYQDGHALPEFWDSMDAQIHSSAVDPRNPSRWTIAAATCSLYARCKYNLPRSRTPFILSGAYLSNLRFRPDSRLL